MIVSDDSLSDPNKLDQDNPWPGLEGFAEENEQLFKGRDRETIEFFRLIKSEQLSVLYGKSGFGKSSLLRAGVFPELRRANFVPIYIVLRHDEREPALSQQVKEEICRVIENSGFDAPKPQIDETLWEYFHRKDVEWWNRQNNLLTPVLIFDQFEEVITVGRENPMRQSRSDAFLTELENLAEHNTPESVREQLEKDPNLAERFEPYGNDFKLVLALREDFLPELEGLRGRLTGVITNRYRLLPMNGQQALEVVLKPAPNLVDDSVAIEIVDRVSRSREEVSAARAVNRKEISKRIVEPALLSMLCSQLNRKRRELGLSKITPDLVGQAQVEAVLHEFYDRGMAVVSPQLQTFVEDRLITASGARNRCAREDALLQQGISATDIEKLIDARILRLDVSSGVAWLELTHDRLAEIARAKRDARLNQLENERKLAEARERESEALRRLARSKKRTRRLLVGSIGALVLVITGAVMMQARAKSTKLKAIQQAKVKAIEQANAENRKKEEEMRSRRMKELSAQVEKTGQILERLAAQTGISGAAAHSTDAADTRDSVAAQGTTKVTVLVTDLKDLLSVLNSTDPVHGAKIARETILNQAAEGLLSYRAGAVDDAKQVLEPSVAKLASLREAAPEDAEIAGREVDVRFALGDLLREKLGPRSTDSKAIESVGQQYDAARNIIEKFLARSPADSGWRTRKADCLERIGDLFKVQALVKKARESYAEARSTREAIFNAPGGKSEELQLAIARNWNKVGNSYYAESPKNALENYEKALAALSPPSSSDAHSPGLAAEAEELRATIFGNIGGSEAKFKRWREVQEAYHRQVEVLDNLHRSNPANLRWRKALAAACDYEAVYNLLEVPPAMRRPDVALPLAAKAVILSDERNRDYLQTLSSAYYNFTDKHRKQAYEELKKKIDALPASP
jgi:tetratricopeptide (TPR) repeat protein